VRGETVDDIHSVHSSAVDTLIFAKEKKIQLPIAENRYTWFRDSPEEKQRQRAIEAPAAPRPAGHGFPWRAAARSQTVWAVLGLAFCYVYVYTFFRSQELTVIGRHSSHMLVVA
jgi:hypothetical protein